MKTVTVATFHKLPQAQALKERLEASHIHAEVSDGSRRERLWFVAHPRASFHLDVDTREFEKAQNLLHAWDAMDGALHDAVRCPECRSSRIEYPQLTHKFFLPNLIGLLTTMHIVEKEYYCEECHHTWLPEDAKPPRPRAHMAPNYFIEDLPPSGEKSRVDR